MTTERIAPGSAKRLIRDAADAELGLLGDELKAERRYGQQIERLAAERERYDKARSRFERARAEVEQVRQRLLDAHSAWTAGPRQALPDDVVAE
ncbi:MAG: hypothetical protein ACR2OO_00155 [Thermomicrobiales bacterium]